MQRWALHFIQNGGTPKAWTCENADRFCLERSKSHVSLWGMSKLEQEAATVCGDNGFMLSSRDMAKTNDISVFLISEKRIMSPACHTKFSWCGGLEKYRVKFSVSSMTPRSIGNKRVFSDIDTGGWYLKSENRLVAVNIKTRSSANLPQSYYESMSELVDHEEEPLITSRQDTLTPPDTAFKTSIQTRYSDLDFNSHINTSEYYRFCTDASSQAAISGYYRHFTSDIVKYPVMMTEATFLGECGPDEDLVVYTWQDDDDFTKLYFAFYLKEVKIFQSCFKHDSKMSQDKVISSL
ncbi:uncharacterized protein LOC117322496 isoform X1 [Pecten maximus]|uniref:uncharacterized protein LOC117322496 isoform X1 n=1 Tax=Pecten maximus TaxID=6579 RepID=UPI001458CC59|nr:uncharacterized protein LOC117322496 isoform X1 [Pecten maximus]